MTNYNGTIQVDTQTSIATNRAFLYADALFDTLIAENNQLHFFEAHYFRLVASMRQLRMEIPSNFTQEYWQNEILKTISESQVTHARVRTTIFREANGLYTPTSNKVSFIIQVSDLFYETKQNFKLGIYKDNYLNTNRLNNLKTTNRIQNVLASIYAKENQFDSCILLNHKKQVAEAIHANIFVVFGKEIKTPPLSEGCIDGVIRKEVIKIIKSNSEYLFTEASITPFELQQASEIFLTNSVIGVQSVTIFKKKSFEVKIGSQIAHELGSLNS